MRVCFFTSDITKTGGIERVLSIIVSHLAENTDNEIEIVSQFSGNSTPAYEFSDKIKFRTISTFKHGAKPHSFVRILNLAKNVSAVKKFFNSRKDYYDLVFVQSFPNAVSIGLTGFNKRKIIVHEHVYAQYYKGLLNKYRLALYSKFRNVIVLTSKDQQYFDRYLPQGHTISIPNPAKGHSLCQSHKHPKRIIAAGRLVYQKGFDTLISAFSKVHQRHSDWELKIFGDGVLRNQLQSQIDKLNLSGSISLCGNSSRLPEELSASQFYVLSSRFEGFGMVLVEACSQGLPCVSFDCPNGPSDIIINNENGILVANQSIDGLAEAMIYMIEHPERRREMSEESIRVSEKFSESEICKVWRKLIADVAAGDS